MRSQEDVFDFIKDCILELKDIDELDIKPDSELMQLGLDSLDFVEVQVLLKRRYGVHVDPTIFAGDGVLTLGDFSQMVVNLPASA